MKPKHPDRVAGLQGPCLDALAHGIAAPREEEPLPDGGGPCLRGEQIDAVVEVQTHRQPMDDVRRVVGGILAFNRDGVIIISVAFGDTKADLNKDGRVINCFGAANDITNTYVGAGDCSRPGAHSKKPEQGLERFLVKAI